jgi:FkbM family methyltransferase
MSILRKIVTAAGLIGRGQTGIFRRQIQMHWRTRRVRRAQGAPFIHRAAGHRLVCYPDLPDSIEQYIQGGDDSWELDLLRRWLQDGDAFVDSGANLGLYTHAIASQFDGRVRVLALEASPELVARLVKGAGILGEKNIEAIQVAVGAETGEVEFHLARPGRTTVSQSMRIDAAESADYERHVLPMRPLAALATQHLGAVRVGAVKVDVEGAEPLALQGAPPAWLAADGPLWLVEINVPVLARMGFRPHEVVRHFSAAAFERWIVPKYPLPGHPAARPRRYQDDEQYADAQFHNLVAVPLSPAADARRARIRGLLP